MARPTTYATSATSCRTNTATRRDKPSCLSRSRWDRHSCLSAFTVVEMLVVLAIIMLLLAMLLPMLDKIRRQAQVTAQKADFGAIAAGLDAYKNDFGWYPNRKIHDQMGWRGLGWYLLGSSFGSGIRVATDNSNPTAVAMVGRVYGPYLPPAKWRLLQLGGSLFLMDRWGGPVLYMPRRLKPAADAAVLGMNYHDDNFQTYLTLPVDFAQFIIHDGWTYFPPHSMNGICLAFMVRIGDDDSNGKIDLAAGERLRHDGPYILWSGGPEGAVKTTTIIDSNGRSFTIGWGFEDFDANHDNSIDAPMVDLNRPSVYRGNTYYRYCIPAEARRRIDKSDDIYNFER